MANTTPPEPETITSVEISWVDGVVPYDYRVNGDGWHSCDEPGGHVPASDKPEDLRDAVVFIAWQHGLSIHADDVTVEGLYASYEELPPCTERTRL